MKIPHLNLGLGLLALLFVAFSNFALTGSVPVTEVNDYLVSASSAEEARQLTEQVGGDVTMMLTQVKSVRAWLTVNEAAVLKHRGALVVSPAL